MSVSGQQWTSGVHRPSPRSRRPGFVSIRLLAIVGIVVALVAGSAGFFIGRRSTSDSAATTGKTAKTTVSSTASTVATTAAPSIDRKLTTVVVANGSGVKGAAAVATTSLKTLGYSTLAPANTTGTTVLLVTQVFAISGSEAAAAQVIADLHLANVVAATTPADAKLPVPSASLQGAGVIVILGTDAAPRIVASAATTVAAPSGSAPSAVDSAAPGSATPAASATTSAGTTIQP